MPSIFDTPQCREIEARFHQQKNRLELVNHLQSKWPNIHLEIVEEPPNERSISLIIDDIRVPVITFHIYDSISDKIIVGHLVAAIKDLKRQKRKATMEHLLNIERYTR